MTADRRHTIVIGGGAAGFFGGIICAQQDPYRRVTLVEAGRQLLSKVKISGGGRCNVTHACFDPALLVQHYPRGGKALRGAFTRFQPQDMVAWLQAQGVRLKTEADGRMFPITDDSETIVACLYQAARQADIDIQSGVAVTQVSQEQPDRFQVQLKSGRCLTADRVLLATGSSPQGYQIARSLGHTILPPVPSLFTLQIQDPRLQDLAGIAVDPVQIYLVRAASAGKKPPKRSPQTGALLITHWGISGPAVLKLSAWEARSLYDCRYRATVVINWLPDLSADRLRQTLLAMKTDQAQRTIVAHCPLKLPRRLWERLVGYVGISPTQRWAELSKPHLASLVQEISQGAYEAQGKGVFKEEFVTCGGVALNEVDFKTMESRCCPGLHFAGEVLDIDGVTGGFNFQSAWTTAWIAGQAMGAV